MTRALGYLWAAPVSLLCLAAFLLLVLARQLAFAPPAEGVLQFVIRKGSLLDRARGSSVGFSGGWCVIFTEESIRQEWIRGHELEHTFGQHFVWGPFFPVVYVLVGLLAVLDKQRFYEDNEFEKLARAAGDLRNIRSMRGS